MTEKELTGKVTPLRKNTCCFRRTHVNSDSCSPESSWLSRCFCQLLCQIYEVTPAMVLIIIILIVVICVVGGALACCCCCPGCPIYKCMHADQVSQPAPTVIIGTSAQQGSYPSTQLDMGNQQNELCHTNGQQQGQYPVPPQAVQQQHIQHFGVLPNSKQTVMTVSAARSQYWPSPPYLSDCLSASKVPSTIQCNSHCLSQV